LPGDLQENEQLAAGLVGAVLTRDLLEPMGCTITSADGVVRLDTPLGEMAIEYSGAQVAGQFCLMAIFTDLDVGGKRRDLYAVKMSWNELWTDTAGQPLSEDRQGRLVSAVVVADVVLRSVAAKLHASEARFDRLMA